MEKPRMMPVKLADDHVVVVVKYPDGDIKTVICRHDGGGAWLAYHHTHGRIGVGGTSPLDATYTLMRRYV